MKRIELYELSTEDTRSISEAIVLALMTSSYMEPCKYNIMFTISEENINVDIDMIGVASDCHFSISKSGGNRICDNGCFDVLQNLKNSISECGEELYCVSAVVSLAVFEETLPKMVGIQVSNVELYEK